MNGLVNWFNDAKGYGLITPDEGSEDVFVHHSSIQVEGTAKGKSKHKTLYENQRVSFDVEKGPKGLQGLQAANVTPL